MELIPTSRAELPTPRALIPPPEQGRRGRGERRHDREPVGRTRRRRLLLATLGYASRNLGDRPPGEAEQERVAEHTLLGHAA